MIAVVHLVLLPPKVYLYFYLSLSVCGAEYNLLCCYTVYLLTHNSMQTGGQPIHPPNEINEKCVF